MRRERNSPIFSIRSQEEQENKNVECSCVNESPKNLHTLGFWVSNCPCLFWYSAGFFPPPGPSVSAADIAKYYEENRLAILLAATATMNLAGMAVLWVVSVWSQLQRIETSTAQTLSMVWLAVGVFNMCWFYPAGLFWTAAAGRDTFTPETIKLLHDIGWLSIVMPVFATTIQGFAAAFAIFSDPRDEPIFPRWGAYFNLWIGILIMPGAFAGFFKTGPFAYNGLFDLWLAFLWFSLWFFVNSFLVLKASRRQNIGS